MQRTALQPKTALPLRPADAVQRAQLHFALHHPAPEEALEGQQPDASTGPAAAGSAQPNALGAHLAERPDSADGSLASTASTAAAAAPALLASSEDDDCLFPD